MISLERIARHNNIFPLPQHTPTPTYSLIPDKLLNISISVSGQPAPNGISFFFSIIPVGDGVHFCDPLTPLVLVVKMDACYVVLDLCRRIGWSLLRAPFLPLCWVIQSFLHTVSFSTRRTWPFRIRRTCRISNNAEWLANVMILLSTEISHLGQHLHLHDTKAAFHFLSRRPISEVACAGRWGWRGPAKTRYSLSHSKFFKIVFLELWNWLTFSVLSTSKCPFVQLLRVGFGKHNVNVWIWTSFAPFCFPSSQPWTVWRRPCASVLFCLWASYVIYSSVDQLKLFWCLYLWAFAYNFFFRPYG